MKRMTVRLNDTVAKKLQNYKIIFRIKHKNVSYNLLINALIYSKLPTIKINRNYINYFLNFKHKSDQLHSKKFYQNYTKKLAQLTNSINGITRQIKGIANNINQITHVANLNSTNDVNLGTQLKQYHQNIKTLNSYCLLLSRKLVQLWQM